MTYIEFADAVEKMMNKKMKGGVRASLYTAMKNNGKENGKAKRYSDRFIEGDWNNFNCYRTFKLDTARMQFSNWSICLHISFNDILFCCRDEL